MFTRCIIHGMNNRQREIPVSSCLKRRWNDRQLKPLSQCWSSSNLSSRPHFGNVRFYALRYEQDDHNAGHNNHQYRRDFHSSIPPLRERPIHSTTSRRYLSPASSAIPRLDDDDDDDNHNNEYVYRNSYDWQRRESQQSNESRWYGGSFTSSARPSLEDQLGETNVWDVGSLVEDDVEDDDDASFSSNESEALWKQERKEYPPTKKYSGVDVMKEFDASSPPQTKNLEDLQLWLECEAHLESAMKYQKVLTSARNRKDYASLPMVQRQLVTWHEPLAASIETMQTEFVLKRRKFTYGPYLCSLPAQKLAVVTAHEAVMHLLKHGNKPNLRGCLLSTVAQKIGDAVEDELDVQRVLRKRAREARTNRSPAPSSSDDASDDLDDPINDSKGNFDEMIETWTYGASHLRSFIEELAKKGEPSGRHRQASFAIKRARQLLERDYRWPVGDKVQLGVALLSALIDEATIRVNGVEEKVFNYERRCVKGRHIGYVTLCDEFYKMVTEDSYQQLNPFSTRLKPMVVPSRKWVAPDDGGYCWLKVDLMRYHGCEMQREALRMADLTTVYDGLNVLGRVPWKINKEILEVAQRCWKENIALGDIPSQTNHEVPEEPERPSHPNWTDVEKGTPEHTEVTAEFQKYIESRNRFNRVMQKNMDLHSLRCSAVLKLSQADKFKDFDEIFFPYNIDFRGRAYPIPPHLSTVGSDLCRGLLKFSESKPLGPKGLYWLKVHLANLAGKDKMSFDDRAAFVDNNLENVRASVNDPFGHRWWMELEDPFQALAASHEIIRAVDSGDPEKYMCSLAVHMDGSCNGLQHYAALGRDVVGGRAVNLCNVDSPQDVYIGVMHEVIKRVAEEAAKTLDFADDDPESLSETQKAELRRNKAAKLVDGLIDRSVVKRTVMTSVYGVTFIGARKQIQEKIEEKLEERGFDLDAIEYETYGACIYLAHLTMEVMGELFTGARETMAWLTTCARLISHQGHPVAWVSPIGVPVVQPYRETRRFQVQTVFQKVSLVSSPDDLPIHKRRQTTAFPPNFIHSLDSSHMLFTALEMDRRGLTFSAVHDSFWTHPCDVDEMNEVLRECFVQLYDQPLLERLKKSWEIRYPDVEFPDLPKRGNLDLNEVKSARYFFQ